MSPYRIREKFIRGINYHILDSSHHHVTYIYYKTREFSEACHQSTLQKKREYIENKLELIPDAKLPEIYNIMNLLISDPKSYDVKCGSLQRQKYDYRLERDSHIRTINFGILATSAEITTYIYHK